MSLEGVKIHCVGIGGMGMAPLAVYMKEAGALVSGQDDALSCMVKERLLCAEINLLSDKKIPDGIDRVVYSSAVTENDERIRDARLKGIPVLRRGEMLAEVAENKKLCAIVGSHGKTTTAAMLAYMLHQNDLPVDYIIGGFMSDSDLPSAVFKGGEWLLAEVDESDGTIDGFSPDITVMLNHDWDHADFYENSTESVNAFEGLVRRTKCMLLYSSDDEALDSFVRQAEQEGIKSASFGFCGDYRCEIEESGFGSLALRLSGLFDEKVEKVNAGGRFNAANACAAFAAARSLMDLPLETCLEDFPGVFRRQETLLRESSVRIIADYAHHPSEISELFEYVRDTTSFELVVVFQPHRYSRTKQFAGEFAECLKEADKTILLPVYPASELPLEGVTSEMILGGMGESADSCSSVGSYEEMHDSLSAYFRSGISILFVGAGDIDGYARRFVSERSSAIERWFESVRSLLSESTVLKRDELLSKKTTMRIGGPAKYYSEPANKEDLCALLKSAKEALIPVFILGRGSNLLVADTGYDGLVVHLKGSDWNTIEQVDESKIVAGAGARLQALSAKACKWGISGLEFLEGIPASVGGALRMNAGAMGGWTFDVVEEVEFVTMAGEVMCLSKDDFNVGYRYCEELKNAIAVKAIFAGPGCKDVLELRDKMDSYSGVRVESQPREPSAGCIFKNPDGGHAGKIIDELGLKGLRVGDAEVSEVHGNFIVNKGSATCEDVIRLIRKIRAKAKTERDVDLRPEVMLVGSTWEESL